MTRWLAGFVLIVSCCTATSVALPAAAPKPSPPWIALSDIHLGFSQSGNDPSDPGQDTNPALFESLLAELHRRDPNPPVVIIAGDFLAHEFDRRKAASTFALIASSFDRVYPHAQFLITLGNNDSPCDDYATPMDDAFLSATAKAWAPLVDRHGAAPGFGTSFAHDGSYVATLPIRGLRAVVINDVSFAIRANGSCSAGKNATDVALSDLANAFATAPAGSKTWLLFHVPPGIDAYSTAYLAHRLAVIPFMRPHVREALDADIRNPANHVALVVTGHTHKFSYRISSGGTRVPMLLVPSISPIFNNDPAFLELGVSGTGTIETVREIGFAANVWRPVGDLASLGVRSFTVPQLIEAQRRIEKDPKIRDEFSNLYSGGGPPEWRDNWRVYWCAATSFDSEDFQDCESQHGFSVLRPRALKLVAVGGGVALLAIIVVYVGFRIETRRRRRA